MAFNFQAYRNPYVSTIAELLSRGEDAKAKALVDVANAQARAAEARGQAYGGAIDSVGKMVAGLPAQIQANKNVQEDRAARAEARSQQRQQFGNQQTVFTQGQTDRSNQQLANKATTEEQVLLLPPELQGPARQRLQMYADDTIKHNTLVSSVKTSEANQIGKVARDVQATGYNPVALSLGLDHLAAMNVDVAALKQQVVENPDSLKLLVDHYAGYGAPKPMAVDSKNDLINPDTGAIIRKGVVPVATPAELETARHNKELERIAALTQGRAAAAQVETARHNKAMELNPTGDQSEWKPGRDDNNKLVMYRTVNGKMETMAPPAGLVATGTPQATYNVSAQGKAVLRSTDVAEPMMAKLIADMEQTLPGIGDPTLNAKYNSLSAKAGSLADWAKYSLGFEASNTPQIQIAKLLQAVQAGQYMTSSRNIRMLDLVLSHLSDPKQTPLRQYEALKTLEGIMPEIRAAVLKAEQPMNLNDPVENEPSIDDSFAAYLRRQEAANAGR